MNEIELRGEKIWSEQRFYTKVHYVLTVELETLLMVDALPKGTIFIKYQPAWVMKRENIVNLRQRCYAEVCYDIDF